METNLAVCTLTIMRFLYWFAMQRMWWIVCRTVAAVLARQSEIEKMHSRSCWASPWLSLVEYASGVKELPLAW